MDPLFDPLSAKSPQQVRAEFDSAKSPRQWLENEVADFFAEPRATADERLELAESILEADSNAFEEFLETEFDAHDLVALTISVCDHHTHHETIAAFPELPTPTTLLWTCCQVARPGNEIAVTHRFATGVEIVMSAKWPFGMQEAVAMTTPNPEGLANMYDDDDDADDDSNENSSSLSMVVSARQIGLVATGLVALGALLYRLTTNHRH